MKFEVSATATTRVPQTHNVCWATVGIREQQERVGKIASPETRPSKAATRHHITPQSQHPLAPHPASPKEAARSSPPAPHARSSSITRPHAAWPAMRPCHVHARLPTLPCSGISGGRRTTTGGLLAGGPGALRRHAALVAGLALGHEGPLRRLRLGGQGRARQAGRSGGGAGAGALAGQRGGRVGE